MASPDDTLNGFTIPAPPPVGCDEPTEDELKMELRRCWAALGFTEPEIDEMLARPTPSVFDAMRRE